MTGWSSIEFEMNFLLLLSGPVAVGKSAVAAELIESYGFKKISTGNFLLEVVKARVVYGSRTALQEVGDALDVETDYRWVVDSVATPAISGNPNVARWLLDSVRKQRQVSHFKSSYGDKVFHVHLTASESSLQERYDSRISGGGEYAGNTPYQIAILHPNEVASRQLLSVADALINVELFTPKEIAKEILTRASLRG